MGSPTSMMIAWCLTEDSNFACMEGMRNCFGQRCGFCPILIYPATLRAEPIKDSKLIVPVIYFAEPVKQVYGPFWQTKGCF